jgi:hypothetical protein
MYLDGVQNNTSSQGNELSKPGIYLGLPEFREKISPVE